MNLYALTTELGRDHDLLRAAAYVGVVEEKLVRGFTEVTLLCGSEIEAGELENLLRSKWVGRFGDGWLRVEAISAARWDELLDL